MTTTQTTVYERVAEARNSYLFHDGPEMPIVHSRPTLERYFQPDTFDNVGRWCDVAKQTLKVLDMLDTAGDRGWQLVGYEGIDEDGNHCYAAVHFSDPRDYGITVRVLGPDSNIANLY